MTISHLQVSGSSALANFPALISLPGDAGLQSFAQGNGNDILFTDATGTMKLNHEIEQCGDGAVDGVGGDPFAVAYGGYGDLHVLRERSGGEPAERGGGVERDVSGGVHRSKCGAERERLDGERKNGTVIGTGTGIATGEISGGQSFNGSSYENVGSSASLNVTGPLTVSGWVNTTDTATLLLFGAYANGSPYNGYGLGMNVGVAGGYGIYNGAGWHVGNCRSTTGRGITSRRC